MFNLKQKLKIYIALKQLREFNPNAGVADAIRLLKRSYRKKTMQKLLIVCLLLIGTECQAQIFPNPYMVLIQQCNEMKAEATTYRNMAINQKNQAITTQATMPDWWNYYNTQINNDPNIPQYLKDQAQDICLDADSYENDGINLLAGGNILYNDSVSARNNGDAALLMNDYGGALSWYIHSRDDARNSYMLYMEAWMSFWEAGSCIDDLILIKNTTLPTIPIP